MTEPVHDLRTHPVHLGLGAAARAQPAFTGMEWYAAYSERTAPDGAEGRLVSMYDFAEKLGQLGNAPGGRRTRGLPRRAMTLHQELADGSARSVTIGPGEYAINPPGAWHTADVDGPATALFITAGAGTQHRPR